MTAYDWCALLAVGVLTALLIRYSGHRDDDQAAWQRTAAEAARDVAEARRQREIAQLEAWLQLRPQRKNTIPHQTRRTEEDQ